MEKWNPWAKRRQDLWGADILARRGSEPLLAIQATTKANMAARLKKTAQDRRRWLDSGNFFLVHGWKKKKTRYELTSR